MGITGPTTPGAARARGVAMVGAQAGLTVGAAMLAGASFLGPGIVPAMLIAGATDLFGRVVPNLFKGKVSEFSHEHTGDPMHWLNVPHSGAQWDERESRYGPMTVVYPEQGIFNVRTGERIGDAPEPVYPTVPAPIPQPPPPSEAEPVSFISTGLGMLGSFAGDLLGGVTGLVDDLMPLAGAVLPFFGGGGGGGGGQPGIVPGPVPGYTPPTYPGASPVSFPIALPGGSPIYVGGAVSPAFGLPGVDLAPPGSTPITPYAVGGGTRLPSTVEVPYQTRSGATRYAHFKNMGRPLLYSGDLAACKRVRKVGSKARRRSGGR